MELNRCYFALYLLFFVGFPTLGYFVYGGLIGFFAIMALSIICLIALLLSLIPYIGIFLQVWVIISYILPFMENMGIYSTALTTCIIGLTLIAGLIMWVVSSEMGEGKVNNFIAYHKRGIN
ncbi:MAG: hypothetical protein WC909_01820 [Candidatus Paceibacterota bacterium]|jgi:hypothetical protein